VSSSLSQVFADRIGPWFRQDVSERPFIADSRLRLFLVSFSLLFYELLCIRWIPAYVRYLSYFTNIILMASFLGIGLGILAARRKNFWFPPFPLMLLIVVVAVALNRFELNISSTDVLYFGQAEAQAAGAESFVLLPLIFGLVALSFIPLARPLGQLLNELEPLTAYTFDILGSLAGTAAFFLIAYFSLPPLWWFLILLILLLALSSPRTGMLTAGLVLASLAVAVILETNTYWSPYYKIVLTPAAGGGYNLDVNNISHQTMIPWQLKEPFYRRVYELFPDASFSHALILGAGTGSDAATALAVGVKSVTAVEIDPVIYELGARLNPDHPYSDPRVRVVIDDGRAFLRNDTGKYDLIIFALPDSLTLTSSVANLRLESYLLTEEAIRSARDHLTGNGLVVLYNYYREPWLVEKLASMVARVFNQSPFVSTYGGWGRAAVIIAGPRLAQLPSNPARPYHENATAGNHADLRVIGEGLYPPTTRTPATDDWPFLYLPEKSFPLLYVQALAVIGVLSLLGILGVGGIKTLVRFDWHMFFLGVAFALLEVRALTTFALLFGSTWMVNSLVFFAILSSVLFAVLFNARFQLRRIEVFYALLFAVLALDLWLRPETLLFQNVALRYLVASFLSFAPVFLANVIFANSFRDTAAADIAFASNLIGIMLGAILEYLSMLIGYNLLLVPVMIFYLLAMLLRRRVNLLSSPKSTFDLKIPAAKR
jgi:Spermine/spermidine synthase domain